MTKTRSKQFDSGQIRLFQWAAALSSLIVLSIADPAWPQALGNSNVYHPLDHRVAPGIAGHWAGMLGKATPGVFQPVLVELPSSGKVAIFGASKSATTVMDAPAQIGMGVGYTYRLRISDMPEFPGIELYPSIELLDRLHPPAGKEEDFPIPVEFTFDEIQFALNNRMVTKVVYLEQPQLAAPVDLQKPMTVLTLPTNKNLLAEADLLGRPMAIVRLGGRLPDVHRNDAAFFGNGAPTAPSKKRSSRFRRKTPTTSSIRPIPGQSSLVRIPGLSSQNRIPGRSAPKAVPGIPSPGRFSADYSLRPPRQFHDGYKDFSRKPSRNEWEPGLDRFREDTRGISETR